MSKKVKLKDIATYINGKAFKPTEWQDSGLPIVRIQNLTGENKAFNYFDGEIDDKYILNNGDLLISWSATLDIYEWNRGEAVLNQHIFKVLFNKNIEVDKNFFKLAIKNVLHNLERFAHGSTMKHIIKKDFDNFEINLPPLEKQNQIAKILDKANKLIELRKESITKLDALAKSIFIDMFGDPVSNPKGWETKKLKEIIILQRGHDLPTSQRDLDGEIDLYGASGLSGKHNIPKVFGGGIITGRSGTIGQVNYTKKDFWPLNTTLFSKETFNNNLIFLCYLLRFLKLENYANYTSVPTLNRNIIHEIEVYDISIELQNKFAKIIEKIEEQKSLYEKELELLQNNFDALLQKSFEE